MAVYDATVLVAFPAALVAVERERDGTSFLTIGSDQPGPAFRASKRAFDIAVATAGLPVLATIGIGLALANPFANRGPLLHRQVRMGLGGRRFVVWKFRTMTPEDEGTRGHDDPLDAHRITPLGGWLRQTRIDELPQLLNVLVGQMSLIGPRPDLIDHADAYVALVPNYAKRHAVRPGMSGLAQVRMGYAEGLERTLRKARLDLIYIRRSGWRMEAHVLARTITVLATGFGAK